MTKAEKRYFKIYSAKSGNNQNNYLRLFDFVDGMKVYDETQIKTNFAGEHFLSHFPTTKNYLYEKIMESLRSYEQNTRTDPQSKMMRSIQNASIFSKKGLSGLFWRETTKAQKIGEQYDLLYHQLFLSQEKLSFAAEEMVGNFQKDRFSKELGLFQELRKKIDALLESNYLVSNGFYFFLKDHLAKESWEWLKEEPLLNGEKTAHGILTKFNIQRAKIFLCFLNHDFDNAIVHSEKLLNLFFENPEQIKVDIRNLVRSYHFYFLATLFAEKYYTLNILIADYRKIPKKYASLLIGNQRVKYLIDVWGNYMEMMSFYRQSQYENLIVNSALFFQSLFEHQSFVTQFDKSQFYHHIAHAYLQISQLDKAFDLVNEIREFNLKLPNPISAYDEDLIRLFIYFEMGENRLVNSEIRRLKNMLKTKSNYLSFWKPIFELIKDLSNCKNKEDRKPLLEKQKERFLAEKKNKPNQTWTPIMDIPHWINKKLELI